MVRAGSATCVQRSLGSLMVHDGREILSHSQWPPEACHERYVANVLGKQARWIDFFAVFDAVERCLRDGSMHKPIGIAVIRGAVNGTGHQAFDTWSSRHEDGEQPEVTKLLQYAEEDVESLDLPFGK